MAINSLSASSKGLSGLVSGMDTQTMVEKLLSGTQAKIDKASQNKTVLQYKQSLYLEVASKLKTLQTSFMSFSSATNLYSASFYNTMNAIINTSSGTSSLFSVSASSDAKAGSQKVDYVKQLASAYSMKTSQKASGNVTSIMSQGAAQELVSSLTGENNADTHLTIEVGSKKVVIKDVAKQFGGKTSSEIVSVINQALADGGVGASARFVNNKLTITADNASDYIAMYGNTEADGDAAFAIKMFGGSTGASRLEGKGSLSQTIDSNAYLPSFTIDLDGSKQTIYMSMDALTTYANTGDASDLADGIEASLKRAFGSGIKLTRETDNGTVVGFSLSTGDTQQFKVTADYQVAETLGITSGISNKINTSLSLNKLNFNTALQGNLQSFSINGVEFSYTTGTSLSTIFSDIEKSEAGVRVSYDAAQDRFVLESKVSGLTENYSVDFDQTEGNLLSVLFGVAGSGAITGHEVRKDIVGGTLDAATTSQFNQGGNFTFNINGRDYTFNVKAKNGSDTYTTEEFVEQLNISMKNTFGKLSDGTPALEMVYDDVENRMVLKANDPALTVKVTAQGSNNKSLFGFDEGDTTQVTDKDTLLSEAGITFGAGGISIKGAGFSDISIAGSDLDNLTLDQVAAKIKEKLTDSTGSGGAGLDPSKVDVVFDEATASFRISGIETDLEISVVEGAGSENLKNLFGQKTLTFDFTDTSGTNVETQGQNAIVSINGNEIERISNNFTVDGVSFTLHTVSEFDSNGKAVDPPTTITIERDTDSIMEAVQEYIKLYNETVEYINGLYKAETVYKDYAPLTAAQKAEMSEKEIELWEEKSKEGLLRNDSTLYQILRSMRSSMTTKPEGSSISIYDLGLSIGSSYDGKDGYLVESSSGKIKAALINDPDAFRQLFAGTGGLMEMLNTAINDATSTSGSLTTVAGKNALDSQSTIAKQIKDIESQMDNLELRYQKQYTRYWNQFTAMEQMIQSMNTQSAWLSQQFT